MSKPTVYVETTVISYLAARPSRDPIVAGHQQATRDFWSEAPARFRLLSSEFVVRECSSGDLEAAAERLRLLRDVEKLEVSDAAIGLTNALLEGDAIPPSEPRDAAHIAVAAVHGIQYLVTWNFRHIANPQRQRDIELVCVKAGFDPPIICSPESLLGRFIDVV
jgi:predicted nucleic acid-binding protein